MKIVDHINNTVFGPNEQDLIKYPRAEIHHQRFLQVVEVSCRVGLIGFAAFRAPIPFAIAFSVGGVLGGAYSLFVHLKKFEWTTVRNVMPACAQNFMEYLSGTKFPAVIARVVTAVFIGAHIYHDPQFFVPFCSLFLGFWVGKDIVHGTATLFGRGYKKLQGIPAQENCGSCCHAS